jgi:2,3-bisphosphoglycerate-independent phosphoglycerate mutase
VSLKKPVVLTILDGWGYRAEQFANAIALARKPTYDKLLAEFPHSLLYASDHFVGLPDGQMGNSEVGHLNIGSGRVVHMDITRIDDLIRSGEFFRHPVIVQALKHAAEKGRALHLMGLVSDGGVHSQQAHLYALLQAARQHGVERVFVHAFLDGRDTLPTSGVGYLEKLQAKIAEIGVGKIASVGGRYFAMDRDRRWERSRKAFDAILGIPEGGAYADPIARVKECYHNGVTDEFVEPFVVVDEVGKPVGPVRDEDAVLCFNYRADRVRQITRVLARNSGLTKDDGKTLPGAEDLDLAIPRPEVPKRLHYVCMTQYDKQFTLPMVILPESMENLLADMLAQANLRNLRIAETEKYAHVTYFFNGGIETPFPGEDRVLVPSQKVATYDLAPEMSASGIADAVIKAIGDPAFDLVVVNFANADMVGHSGKIEPTVKGVETIDFCLGRIYQTLKQRGGSMLITADHGNAELMIDPKTGGPHTAHTTNPVPVILVSDDAARYRLRDGGSLRDISPTLLGMLNLDQPGRMTGGDLRVEVSESLPATD